MARRNVNEVDMNLQIKNRLSLRKVRKIATPEDIQRAGGLRQLQKLINGFHTLPIYVEKTVFDQNGRTTTGKHLYWNYEEYKRSPWWDYIRTKAYVKASAVLDCIPDCQNRLKVKLDANKKPILKDGSRLFVRCRNDMTIRGPFIGHHLNYFTIGCERVRFGIKSMLAKIVGMKDDLIAVCNECHGRGIHHMEMHKEILVPLFARQSTTTNSSPTA